MNTIVEILIDNSLSMGPYRVQENNSAYLLPDGSTRMSLAKRILSDELLPSIDFATKVYVRKFHSLGNKESYRLIIKTIFEDDMNLQSLKQIIDTIPDPTNTGGTPITGAINYSIENLKKYSNWNRKIILVTDGEENGSGNYRNAAKKAIELLGIKCDIHIVGIALSVTAATKAKELAEETNGSFINLTSTDYDSSDIQSKLRVLKRNIVEKTIENMSKSTEKSISHLDNSSTPHNTSQIKNEEKATIQKSEEKTLLVESPVTIESKKLSNIEQVIQNNALALTLISKQLKYLQEELNELKNKNKSYEEGEEIIIKENEEEQKRVGRKCEKFLFDTLKSKYGERLKWLNEEKESGKNHDFEVFDIDDSIEYYIECKGTKSSNNYFYLTKNEWHFFLANTKNYQIYFIKNIDTEPILTKIDNLLDWVLKGKVVPYFHKNKILKQERIILSIIK